MKLITELPLWFSPLCLLLGGLYAFLLYWKDSRFDASNPLTRRLLAAIRFSLVSFLAFLLLGPLIKTLLREVEKPVIVIAQDNSESVLIGKDSAYYRTVYKENMAGLIDGLGKKFEVKTYSFGDGLESGISYKFDDKQTDISALFDELYTVYSNRNVGAVILCSDGLYNKGASPLYDHSIGELNAPIYTVALGDTSVKKDVILAKVLHNRLAYLGNDFPLEVLLEAKELMGEKTTLKVEKEGKLLFSKSIDINKENYIETIPIQLRADATGIQHYQLRLTTLEDEVSYSNNIKDIYIDVLDGRQKILLLSNAPHPDIGAINQAILLNKNYELENRLLGEYKNSGPAAANKFKAYNLIILHQLPAKGKRGIKLVKAAVASGTPILFFLGNQSDINGFNAIETGLAIQGAGGMTNEAQAVVNDQFSLFSIDDAMAKQMRDLPPLTVPFGTYITSKSANVFLKQKIGMVKTEQALIQFHTLNEVKLGVIAGEGIWQWRLNSYERFATHDLFNSLISKIVQYLAIQSDKSQFKVFSKNKFLENEELRFDAEVYNSSYELVNDPEVNMTIINSDDQHFPYTFSRTGHGYKLNAGKLPAGSYKYKAVVSLSEKVIQETGAFTIVPVQIESFRTIADYQLLYNLALKFGGKMIAKEEISALVQEISARDDIKPISYTEKRLKELINLKWVFFVLLFLLSTEWFVRKRAGVY